MFLKTGMILELFPVTTNVEPPQYFKGVRSKLFKMLKGKIAQDPRP